MRNRGIGRARIFMGTALLLAAALTWGIGLMMSPHGETVAKGTEYLRSTVVTFRRNGAFGTLVLCALAAWLLFPARRPKWPLRDWSLVALFVFLAASSIYTLISFGPFAPPTANPGENYAVADMNEMNASSLAPKAAGSETNAPPEVPRIATRRAVTAVRTDASPRKSVDGEVGLQDPSISQSRDSRPTDADSPQADNSTAETDENEE